MNLGRYGSREILDTQIIDYVSATPIMYMDYANTVENAFDSEIVYATGGSGNPRRISFIGSKTSTLTINTQIFTMQHLAMLAGENIISGTENIFKREVLVVESDGSSGKQIVLSQEPVGGASGVGVYSFENGIKKDPQPAGSLSTKTLTLGGLATVDIGDEVEVYYQFQSTSSNKLSFTAKGFPKYVKIIGDTLYADEVAGDEVAAQIVYHKARLQPNFTLNMSPTGDPTSISMVYDIFPVKVNGVDTLADFIIYE